MNQNDPPVIVQMVGGSCKISLPVSPGSRWESVEPECRQILAIAVSYSCCERGLVDKS